MREHADVRNAFADALEAFVALPPNVGLFGGVCRVSVRKCPKTGACAPARR
ncbi:Uncharacterised protein [Mycobacteroides abscessus subsp. bolletii]|uniref:hypothetical protein n=1 Tax=Mycobacteroides abscessus TaxID=36809 RepID=UPI0009C94718|nr:hypothetical protein [Mycobacteroides abscessus]SKT82309.1 Uncharacterised protein [Mycobacteroides abscessus subsp. bolletii]